MDYRLIINRAMQPQRTVVYTTFSLCQPQHQITWQERIKVYVIICACVSVCRQSSRTKGIADLVSCLKLEQIDWLLSLTNRFTVQDFRIHSSSIFTSILKWMVITTLFLLCFSFYCPDSGVALNPDNHVDCSALWRGTLLWCNAMWSSLKVVGLSDAIHETV